MTYPRQGCPWADKKVRYFQSVSPAHGEIKVPTGDSKGHAPCLRKKGHKGKCVSIYGEFHNARRVRYKP